MKILFVCRGNVGRSQWAEAYFNHYSKNHNAASAGTEVDVNGQTLEEYGAWMVWKPMDEEGFNIRGNKRKQLTAEAIENSNLVIAITEKRYCPDYLLQNPNVIYWDVPDAKGTDYETHVRIKNAIKGLVQKLIEELSS